MYVTPDGDNFFDIVAGVLQGDILAPFLFIIWLDYVQQMSIDLMKENSFILKKDQKSMISIRNWYWCRPHKWSSASCKYTCSSWSSSAQPGADSERHQSQCEYRYFFRCFNQDGAISSLNGKPLKLVNQFPCLGNHISFIKHLKSLSKSQKLQ